MLYHFLETQFLVSLLRRNSFRTSPPELSNDADGNLVYIYSNQRFISFTRNRNPLEGYPVLMLHESCCLRQHLLQSDARSPYSQESFEFQV